MALTDIAPTIVTHGSVVTAPTGAVALVDTGNLRKGLWLFLAHLSVEESVSLLIQHRTAGNSANVDEVRWISTTEIRADLVTLYFNVTVEDESIRVMTESSGGTGLDYQASLYGTFLDSGQ